MIRIVHGTVHGKIIQLDDDLGIPDGQRVEVRVKVIGESKSLSGPPPGCRPGSTKTAAGSMAEHWTEEDDRIMREIYEDRKRS